MADLRQRGDEEQRSTFLELFFDLVFVFAVTQLSHVLLEDLSLAGAGTTLFLLLVVWWAWISTTWMTNWFDPDAVPVRVVLITGMACSLLMAVAIPAAFEERALLFAVGYVGLQFIRNAFVALVTPREDPLHDMLVRIWIWSTWVGAIWIAGAFLPEEARIGVWLVALILDYAGPAVGYWVPVLGRSSATDWEIEHGHFAERFHLFIIIVLGESIVITGASASDGELTRAVIAALGVAFLITAAFWWLYFDDVAKRSTQELAEADDERGRLGRDAFTYLHIPIVAGVIVAAVGDELVVEHPGASASATEALVLVAGPILYLLGLVGFRLRMRGTLAVRRLVTIAVLAAVGLVALAVPLLVTWTLVLAALAALATGETLARVSQNRASDTRHGAGA
jgi:low temperature requirement protein LtrA